MAKVDDDVFPEGMQAFVEINLLVCEAIRGVFLYFLAGKEKLHPLHVSLQPWSCRWLSFL